MSGPERRGETWAVWMVLLGLTLALDTFFYTGFFATADDNCYLLAAHRLAQGLPLLEVWDVAEQIMAILRLAITLPMALVSFLARGRIFWVAYSFIAYHLALVVLAWLMANLLHGRLTAWLTAALTACAPLLYLHAGACLPDLALALWMGLAILALLYLQKNREALQQLPRRQFLLAGAAGLCTAMAYSCKESGLILVLPAAIGLTLAGPRLFSLSTLRACTAYAAGLLAGVCTELLLIRLLSGQWVLRPLLVAQSSDHYIYRIGLQGLWPLERALYAQGCLEPLMPYSLWVLLATGIVYPLLKGSRYWLCLTFWWLAIFLTIGSTSLTSYLPPPIQPRYYSIAIIPAALMLAQVLLSAAHWLRAKTGPRLGPMLSVILLALPLLMAAAEVRHNLEQAGEIYRARQVRSFLEALDNVRTLHAKLPVVLSQALSDRMLALFLADPGKLIIRNHYYRQYQHPIPEPPFIMLEDWQLRGPQGLALDLPPRTDGRTYHYHVVKIVKPDFSRCDTLLQGNALVGLNPVLAEQRIRIGDKYDTAILLVYLAAQEENK